MHCSSVFKVTKGYSQHAMQYAMRPDFSTLRGENAFELFYLRRNKTTTAIDNGNMKGVSLSAS